MRAVAGLCVLWSVSAAGQVAPPTTAVARDGCVTARCHPGVKDHAVVHGPVIVNACDSCHQPTNAEEHTFDFLRDRQETCTLCHVVDTPEGDNVHGPVAEGECLACHDPHGGAGTALLRGRRYADSCSACHEDVTAGHDRIHGPVSAGACGACHLPHSSPNNHLLVEEGRELCLRCHVVTAIELESSPVVHEPAASDCRICHDPHATDERGMLTSSPGELCTTCHSEIAEQVRTATTQHAAVTTERECMNCHVPHASQNHALLRERSTKLCFECHDRAITLENGRIIQDMKTLIENGTSLHGAIAEDTCVGCHEIHGGGHERLLTEEYPSVVYLPFSESAYALCFGCHDRDMVLQERSDAVTGFRNGDRNLHFVHVNQDEKGRTCRVCHDAHASNREKHIRDEVTFGPSGWSLPIGYAALATGGRCDSGCHRPLEYDRFEPIEYPEEEHDGAWKGEDLVPGVRSEPGSKTDPP